MIPTNDLSFLSFTALMLSEIGVDNLNHLKLNINCIESSKTKSIINKVDEILTTNKSLLNPANWKS